MIIIFFKTTAVTSAAERLADRMQKMNDEQQFLMTLCIDTNVPEIKNRPC